jgi:serine/threonine protein kinase
MGGGSSILTLSFSPTLTSSSSSVLKSFKIKSILGKGGCATVYLVKENYSQEIAIKRTEFHTDHLHCAVEMAIDELEALKRVSDHSFITRVHGAFHLNSCCYLLLEYHSGGDLRSHLKSCLFTEQQVAYFVSCLGSALHHLHQRGILHRDIKPENILLSSHGIPKLTDFGTAYIEEDYTVPVCNSSTGTLCYMAPETLTISKYHSYQSDFWSLGITTFELLFHCRPFSTHCSLDLIHFVGNQYQSLWNQILTEQTTQQLKKNSNPLKMSCSFPEMDQFYDFQKMNEPITADQRQAECPFPFAYFPSTDDLEFMIPIPSETRAGHLISFECQNFMKAILDPRIPHRLGQLSQSQFHLFANHSWFEKYNYHSSSSSPETIHTRNTMTRITPTTTTTTTLSSIQKIPFLPTLSVIEKGLKLKYRHERIPVDFLSFPNDETVTATLPDDLIKKLQGYQFPSPSSDSLSNSLSTNHHELF